MPDRHRRHPGRDLAALAPAAPDGTVLRSPAGPLRPEGGLVILRGSLAPFGAVVKIAGLGVECFDGTARVFDDEDAAMGHVAGGRLAAGDRVVIRYEGPRGGPRMPEMLAVTAAVRGAGRRR